MEGRRRTEEKTSLNVAILPADQVLFKTPPKLIGESGFSEVHVATYQGKEVAVKTITGTSYGGDLYKAAKEEALLLATFASPHVVKVHGVIKDQPSVVMDLMHKGSLSNAIQRRPRQLLSLEQRVKICGQIAEAIAVVHSQRYLFADIKSDNVLLDENYNAVLSDFGLSTREEVGRLGGTPGYAPAEIIRNNKITKFSEMYNLGVFFLEVLYFNDSVFSENLMLPKKFPALEVLRATAQGVIHKNLMEMLAELQDKAETGKFIFQDNKTTLDLLSIVRQCLEWEPEKRITLDKVVAFFRPLFSSSKEATAVAELKPSVSDTSVQPISTPQETPAVVPEASVPVAPDQPAPANLPEVTAVAEPERRISEPTKKTPLLALNTFQPASKSKEKEQTSWLSSMCKCLSRRA